MPLVPQGLERRMSLVNMGTLVQEYEHIHTTVGILGNVLFVVGSVLFFKEFDHYYTLAVWMFVIGSFCMLIGALGSGLGRLYKRRENKPTEDNANNRM
jgi:uncharacterized membrane protein